MRHLGFTETSTFELVLEKFVQPYQPNQQDMAFMSRIQSSYNHSKQYTDTSLQRLALEVMPVSSLEKKANELKEKSGGAVSYRDALLLELLHWFKQEFFKWVNAPDCGHCSAGNQKMCLRGGTTPNAEERAGAAGVTEVYACTGCGCETRFPRYNDLRKLLTWRKGRCGEWANCFTLCCIALGFEARYIVDWTDHVWTEVWSDAQGRWLHCDCCEDKCDIPLLYEAGWGKKLNYVLAFTPTHIYDVTKRYTRKWDEVVSRRTLVNEAFLESRLSAFNEQIAANLDPIKLVTLFERLETERSEMETPVAADIQGLEGRISGNLEWKIARGEAGPQNQ